MLKAHLEIDRQGMKVIDQPAKSFLVAFPGLFARQWAQANDTLKDTAGQEQTHDNCYYFMQMTSFGGYGRGIYFEYNQFTNNFDADEQGIVIGTDPAAVQPDQYGLISRVRSGEKSGTVLYYGTAVYGLTINTETDVASFKVEAIFQNMSGGTINVNEVGIYANGEVTAGVYPNVHNFCILRDTITQIELANNEFLKVTYTISIAT